VAGEVQPVGCDSAETFCDANHCWEKFLPSILALWRTGLNEMKLELCQEMLPKREH
jgi:hypothetical protein